MVNNNDQKKTMNIEELTQGLLRFLQKAAALPPWVERRKTGVWPKAEISEFKKITTQLVEVRDKAVEDLEKSYKERREEIMEVVEKRRERLEAYTKRRRQAIHTEEDKFIVAGRVTDNKTGVGLPNLNINAFDLDRKYDDRLGSARTDAFGYFRIEYTSTDFKDFGDKMPETYIEVLGEDGKALFTSPKSFVQKAGKAKFIDAAIEGDKVPASLEIGEKINRSVDYRLKGFERRKRTLERRDIILLRGKVSEAVSAEERPRKAAGRRKRSVASPKRKAKSKPRTKRKD